MRLINTEALEMEEFYNNIPPYVILSHTWGRDSEELTFRDVEGKEIDKPGIGSIKLRECCRQARQDGYGYAWIDTCCIDKTNIVELGEAINSMFRWYKQASWCYVYMSDVPSDDNPRRSGSKFRSSRWFGRGWTLQELLAPKDLRFYSSEWRSLGTKGELSEVIESVTGVPRPILIGITELYAASVARRMSWAARRDTKREEDLAYCLLGIFGVTMPMIYGEGGEQAFLRLQEQIMKTTRDDSILAWGIDTNQSPTNDSAQIVTGRILAARPFDFANSKHIVSRHQSAAFKDSMELSSGSLRAYLPVHTTPAGRTVGLLRCGPDYDMEQVVGIPLAQAGSESVDEYIRPKGYAAVLQPKFTQDVSTRLIYISNSHEANMTTDGSQRYLLYEGFAKMNLEVFEVVPGSCWDRSQALIMLSNPNGGIPPPILIRFRHSEDPVVSRQNTQNSRDFVVAFGFEERGSNIEVQCCVMICDQSTSLDDLANRSVYIMQKANGTKSASNGHLHLRVVLLEPAMGQPIFTIRPEALSGPQDMTLDAAVELRKLNIALELVARLEEEETSSAKFEAATNRESLSNKRSPSQHLWDELWHAEDNSHGEWRTLDSNTLLRWAVESNCVDVARLLLDRGAAVEVKDKDGKTPLMWAAYNGHKAVARLLLDRGAAIEAEDELGKTPLMWAAYNGHEAIIRLLLDRGAAIEGGDNAYSRTPLMWAAHNGHEAITRLLLDRGAAIEAKDKFGMTPLIWAACNRHEAIIQLLLDRGAAVEVKDKDNNTPLMWAVYNRHEATTRLLLDRGAAIEAKDKFGRTPLIWAAYNGHEAITRLLLDRGAAIEVKDKDGKTPLMWAAYKGHEAVAQLLQIHAGSIGPATSAVPRKKIWKKWFTK